VALVGAPVRWPVFQQTLVVRVGPFAPAVIRIVTGLCGQDRLVVDQSLVIVKIDFTVIVGDGYFRIHAGRITESPRNPTCGRQVGSVEDVTMPQVPGPVPSPYSPQGSDEQLWRRPAGEPPSVSAPTEPAATYTGPPPMISAGPHWRPRTLIQVPSARALPPQDDAVLDEQERSARTVTYGVGMVAGAIALIVLIVLCGRVIF
jgi:hypothetical protein